MKKFIHLRLITVCMLLFGALHAVAAVEPYAVLSQDNQTVTFFYDDQKASRGGIEINNAIISNGSSSPYGSATKAVFDASFANFKPVSTACWFNNCSSLISIDGIENLNTDNVTDMSDMFLDCSSLTSLDLSGFKTDNVKKMYSMFGGCSGLTSLDLSGFNTDNVTAMGAMFSGCTGLTSLDVSGFRTDNVTDMRAMFFGCLFLRTIYVGKGWSTTAVTESTGMFQRCPNLVGGAGTVYSSSHINHTYAHIDGGTDNPGYFTDKNATPSTGGNPEPYAVLSGDNTVLTFYYDDQKAARNGMDVGPFTSSWDNDNRREKISSGWDAQRESITSVVFDASFADCTTLTSTAWWFFGFENLSRITGIINLKTDNVTSMNGMFYNCFGLTSLDVTGFKTDNVTDMYSMFWGCSSLTSLDLTGFKTDNVTNMAAMFINCSGLTSLDVTGFKTDNVTSIDGMFSGCSRLTSLDVTGFKTDNVTAMSWMFSGCSGLKTIYAGEGWSTAKVTAGINMFAGCTSLVGGTGTRYDESHTDHTYARIDGGASNPGYFTGKNATPVEEDVDEITIKEIGKTTWCSEYDLDFTNVAGIKAYTATGYDNIDKTIWLTRVMKVPAGTGLLVKGDPGTYKIPHAEVQAYYVNMLVGNLGDQIKIEETDGDKTNYYLSGKDGTFVSVNGSANIGKNKAYLQLPTSVFGGTRSIGISYDDEDGTTSIKNLTPALSEGEGEWYTLQGQRVAKPGKGLYIRNGKKVLVKTSGEAER